MERWFWVRVEAVSPDGEATYWEPQAVLSYVQLREALVWLARAMRQGWRGVARVWGQLALTEGWLLLGTVQVESQRSSVECEPWFALELAWTTAQEAAWEVSPAA